LTLVVSVTFVNKVDNQNINTFYREGVRTLNIRRNPASHCPGNMEAGCNLLGKYMKGLPCPIDNSNSKGLLVAIVNGNFRRLAKF
jgi:hypothetical protein